jgi:hypothetical protein
MMRSDLLCMYVEAICYSERARKMFGVIYSERSNPIEVLGLTEDQTSDLQRSPSFGSSLRPPCSHARDASPLRDARAVGRSSPATAARGITPRCRWRDFRKSGPEGLPCGIRRRTTLQGVSDRFELPDDEYAAAGARDGGLEPGSSSGCAEAPR